MKWEAQAIAMSDRGSMKNYLLGRGLPEERIELENSYFSDASAFEQLIEVENDLIDSYVRGRLPNFERQEFERHYLGPSQRRTRVQFASALAEISGETGHAPPVHKAPFWRWFSLAFRQTSPRLQWGLAAGAMAMVLTIGWLKVAHHRDLRSSLQPPHVGQNVQRQTPAIAAPPPNPAPSVRSPEGAEIAKLESPEVNGLTVELSAGMTRSGGVGTKVFTIPSKTSSIIFQLALDDEGYPAYEAVVETAEGDEIRRIHSIKSQVVNGNRVAILRVPSRLVQAGDYVIRLNGIDKTAGSEEQLEVYSFRAVGK